MKKIILGLAFSCTAFIATGNMAFAAQEHYEVNADNIHEGYFTKKVWLSNYAIPEINISGLQYNDDIDLPAGAVTGDPLKFTIRLGMEQKRPFAVLFIPAYSASSVSGKVKQLAGLTVDINEGELPVAKTAAKTTDVNTSVLSTGTWYKVGVTQTGFFKLDNTFLKSLGINTDALNPADIRVFGNGGNILSENIAVPRIADLAENPLLVQGADDGKFDAGDFAVFYATGPTAWYKDSINKSFIHRKNIYSDTAYYFITVDRGAGLRIQPQAAIPAANVASTGFDYHDVHDIDLVNPAGSGKTWLGEEFYTDAGTNSQVFSFDLGDNIARLNCKVRFGAGQKANYSGVRVTLNGSTISNDYLQNLTGGDAIMTYVTPSVEVDCNSRNAAIGIDFTPSGSEAHGYLDYIELNGRRSLSITGNQLSFRDWQVTGPGKVASYALNGANANTTVWDVTIPTAPVAMQGSLTGGTYTFTQDASSLHEFAALNGYTLNTPSFITTVNNQNLHGAGQANYLIVTHPDFLEAADKIAAYHRGHDNMSVVVATTSQIYNEFSSGGQDISAIRDFARMFYKRAGNDVSKMPQYLLLLGGASYDYKHRIPANCNYVPTFEASNDSNALYSILSDDFFGFLDDSENAENTAVINALDLGVGRLPARNRTDANIFAAKIASYKAPPTLGPWRLATMFVADDNDGAGDHMNDAEVMAADVTTSGNNLYNQQKVYLNAIPIISTPAGPRAPNANAAINEQVYKGTSMINYNGHGNPSVWTGERILTQDDFNQWNNANMLPFMITATCDFGQFDQPQFVSAAEQLLAKEGGGVIATVTTTGAVFAGYNQPMNKEFLTAQFTKNAGGAWNTFGDACRISKNSAYSTTRDYERITNFRKFVLLGDPALIPNFPKENIKLDSIIDGYTLEAADTVKALGKYIIKGSVRDYTGQTLSAFNGTLYVSFFDKARGITVTDYNNRKSTFKLQDNLIYKGKVSVVNGLFSLSFIAPKDINYYMDKAKISTYAENGAEDAAGADTSVTVGGFSDHPVLNDNPPVVRAYINDSMFINGGITGSNTSLFVKLRSETGINVSGYSIGHNLTAVLDGNAEQPYILNDYYETAPNTYQEGYVNFPVTGIPDGRHTIVIKAWDVNNNSGEGAVDFVVVNGKIVDIQNLGNFPNPFSGVTHFVFEHNHPEEQMDVQIMLYNTSGATVKHIKESYTPTGSRSMDITWDGTDNTGALLPPGVYVYRLNIKTEKGFSATAYQKLVIVR